MEYQLVSQCCLESALLNYRWQMKVGEFGRICWAPFSFLFVVTVGEETGWRGYLLPELQRRFSPLISTLILGLIWSLWHSPLYFIGLYDFPGNRLVNALMYIPFAIAFSFQFTWIFNRTGGVLSLALLLHASSNTTLKILPGSSWFLPAMAVFAIFLIMRDKMWKRVNADMT